MSKDPDTSAVEVFRRFVANCMSLQKQLEQGNHDKKYLRDRLMTALGITAIQVSLADHIPRTSQIPVNKTANHLVIIKKTAGSSLVHFARSENLQKSNQALYKLGHTGEKPDSTLGHIEIMYEVRTNGTVANHQKVTEKTSISVVEARSERVIREW